MKRLIPYLGLLILVLIAALATGLSTTEAEPYPAQTATVIEVHEVTGGVTCYLAVSMQDFHADPRAISCLRTQEVTP